VPKTNETSTPGPLLGDYSRYTLDEYRRKILRVMLLAALFCLIFLTGLNIIDWLAPPAISWETDNLILDVVGLLIMAGCWWLNEKRYILLAGFGFTLFAFLTGPLSYPFPYFSRALLLLALPVAISSFIIRPWASLPLAALSITLYTMDYYNSGQAFKYDQLSIFALGVLAVGAWLVSNTLNRTVGGVIRAYDETIRGWVVALEMRDAETLGHSERVVELTLKLARRMGVRESELVNMQRGVLLHDFGKIAIPDAILRKPGPLSNDEWVVMRKHPEYAHTYLTKVSFLAPTLDIPYCHHEKWDGTGYPQGLKAEQIPFSARIFAVVDVWDALISDRPYRLAWPREKALEHIKEQSGHHFDPQVVDVFVEMLQNP
jgi:HD-GYP domain-containing protein (c-di-GMP phosphodiesterase class II)